MCRTINIKLTECELAEISDLLYAEGEYHYNRAMQLAFIDTQLIAQQTEANERRSNKKPCKATKNPKETK